MNFIGAFCFCTVIAPDNHRDETQSSYSALSLLPKTANHHLSLSPA